MNNPKWRNLLHFPASRGDWSSYYPLLFWRQKGEEKARYHIKHARLTAPILLSSPDTANRYVPPVLLDFDKIQQRYQRETRQIFYIYFMLIFLSLLLGPWLPNWIFTLIFSSILLLFIGYNKFNLKLYTADKGQHLKDRWYFYSWGTTVGAYYGYGFLSVMILLGLIQVSGGSSLGGNNNYLLAYGLAYERVSINHEWWRVITGTGLHINLAHWLANTLFGAGFFFMYGASLRLRIVPVALASAFLSFLTVYACWQLIELDSEGIIGFSGGLAGVVGYFFAANLRFPSAFPKQLWVTTLFIANITFLAISMAMSLTSFIAHTSGFLVGMLLGYWSNPISKHFFISDEMQPGQTP